MTGHVALLPTVPDGQPLTGRTPAPLQMTKLLDALLVLEVERQARVTDLAQQVGLDARVLRRLLSSYMVAGDVVGPEAPATIVFGTSAGPLGADEEDDDKQATADVVFLSRRTDDWQVLDDLGRRPVLAEEVARGLLGACAVLEAGVLGERQREVVERLVQKLSTALGASVTAPFDAVTDRLRSAVRERHPVRFRYRDPWTGAHSWPEVQPYDVRRHRARLFLDAGPDPEHGFRSFDVSGIHELEVDPSTTFEPPPLPAPAARAAPFEVVVEVPHGSPAADRLVDGWHAVAGQPQDGRLQLRFDLDRLHAGTRLGVLLLQLGPGCRVVSPPELVQAAAPVAQRLLDTLPPVTTR